MKIVVIGGGGLIGRKLGRGYMSADMRRWQRPLLQASTLLRVRDWRMCWWMLRLLSM